MAATMLASAYWVVLALASLVGWFANLLGLPGLWLIVGSTVIYALLTGFGVYVGWPVVIALVVLGAIAEIVEFIAGAAGSSAAGGSKRGAIGAIVGGIIGGIVGSPFMFIVGTIIGLCVGSFIGAFAVELWWVGKSYEDARKIGVGAAKGRLLGTLGKSAIGAIMVIVAVVFSVPWGATATPAPTPTTAPTTAPTTTTTTTPTTAPM